MQLHVAGGKMFFFIGQPNEKAISFSSPIKRGCAFSIAKFFLDEKMGLKR